MSSSKLVRSLSTRAVKKVDKPRPLKSTLSLRPAETQCTSLEDIMALVQTVSQSIAQNNLSSDLNSQSASLMSKLKLYGPRLEESYEAQLDKAFINFRNGARGDDITDRAVKLNLLHLIELRAMAWQTNPNVNTYYSGKSSNILDTHDLLESSNTLTYMTALSPGEVIKSSGKFASPTKMPGKNYCKDEIIIRNADSGKVNTGAKERLVQITGPDEDKIVIAKQLIEETIKRNASPIRDIDREGESNSSLNSSISEDLPHLGPDNNYTFSISQGDKSVLLLVGKDLELLKTAKIILELNLTRLRDGIHQNLTNFMDKCSISPEEQNFTNATCSALHDSYTEGHQLVEENQFRETSFESDPCRNENESLKENSHTTFKDTDETTKDPPILAATLPVKQHTVEYTRNFLMDCSSSKASIKLPHDWEKISLAFPALIKESSFFDMESHLKKWNESVTERIRQNETESNA